MLYPLKFEPILKTRIWGGTQLNSILNKDLGSETSIGESWELSAVEGSESVVTNGFLAGNTLPELVEVYMDDLVGGKIFEKYGTAFPLLFKFIDAHDNLSVQVHPNDEMAQQKHDSFGKTEMWYVVDAKPGAELYLGFEGKMNAHICKESIDNGTLEQSLRAHKVKKGDAFFIPAGMVHAIGKGIVLAEIQQSSDVTYRLYDYNRKDKDGNFRDLHVKDALESLNFDSDGVPIKIERKLNVSSKIVDCDYFATNLLSMDKFQVIDYMDKDSCVMYMCVSGSCEIKYAEGCETLMKGETMLLPAELGEMTVMPKDKVELLEIWIK